MLITQGAAPPWMEFLHAAAGVPCRRGVGQREARFSSRRKVEQNVAWRVVAFESPAEGRSAYVSL